MGIQGLLPFLKKIHKPMNISQFKGCTVAIDAYCWLHKGAFSCADKLALGEKTEMYVYYCMKYVDYLLKSDIKPILVFDGCHLPSKKEVEKTRRERRDLYRKKAAEFLRSGKRTEARECLQKCIDITPQMALELMNVCRQRGVDCIVAPYEADAQLAYLNKSGIAQVIITEDSDLLLFGCEKVMFKMDFHGNGMLIEQSDLNQVLEIQQGFYTFEKFRHLCILSGCDYLASLPGIGLATACKVFKKTRLTDIRILLTKLSSYLKKSITVSNDYIENFIKAENTFLYQLCFDPIKRQVIPLNVYPPEINVEELKYAGSYVCNERALEISLGNIDIYTGDPIHDYNPDTFQPKYAKKTPDSLHRLSIWNRHYRIRPKISLAEIQPPEKTLLTGKEKVIKLPKKLPVKRRRPDDTLEVPADEEFADMYEESPAKRIRTDEVSSQNETDQSDIDDFQTTQSRKHNTLKCESPSKKITAADVCDISMEEETVDKENHITSKISPLRNRFAISSTKKEKFNVNEKKCNMIIKSRFFSPDERSAVLGKEGSDEDKTSLIKEEKIEVDEESVNKPTDQILQKLPSPENKYKSSSKISPKSKPMSSSKSSKTSHLKKSSSLSSAFSWSKFKFSKATSSENLTTKPVNTPFQTVVIKQEPVNNVTKHDISSEDDFSLNATRCNTLPTESQGSVCSLISIESSSQTSNICSLETDCMPTTQDIEEFQSEIISDNNCKLISTGLGLNKSTFDSSTDPCVHESSSSDAVSNSLKYSATDSCVKKPVSSLSVYNMKTNCDIVKSSYFSVETIVIDDDSIDYKPTILPDTTVKSKQAIKKDCRVSGLSRSNRKKTGTTGKVLDVSQTKIKDLFSRFERKKSDSKGDNGCEEVRQSIDLTPETHTSSKTCTLSIVQRKLLT